MKAPTKLEPKPFRTFRDKYLAVAKMVAALLITSIVSAQTDSLRYSQINGYGFKYKRMAFDSVLMIPNSASTHAPYRAGALRYRASDSTLQIWTGYQWSSIVTGSTGIDTAYMLNDTVLAIETPGEDYLLQVAKRHVDSIYRKPGQDSIFYKIYGVERAILDSGSATRFGLEDAIATGTRLFDANNNTFKIDSFFQFKVISKAQTSGVDAGSQSWLEMDKENLYLVVAPSSGPSPRSYGFSAHKFLTNIFARGHVSGHDGYVQADTNQVILESDPNRFYLYHDSAVLLNFNNLPMDFRIRPLPSTVDTSYNSLVSGPNGQVFLRPGANGGSGGSSSDIMNNVFKDSNYVVLIVDHGESNGDVAADNTFASAGEKDADPRVQIWQPGGYFETLNIGAGNNQMNGGTPGTLHGWELELQNQIATYFNNRTVYKIKGGKGGSTMDQWDVGDANYDTLKLRLKRAIAYLEGNGKKVALCGWYSQGINDVVAGTPVATWKAATLAFFNNIRSEIGIHFPIIMTELIGDRVTYPAFDTYDAAIIEIAADQKNYVYRVETPQGPSGGSATDSLDGSGIHWQYLGVKAVAQRMLKAMVDTAGFTYLYDGLKKVTQNTWRLDGNRGVDISKQHLGTNDTAQVVFKQNGNEAFRIDGSQRLAIGKTTATKIVDINGDILVNSLNLGRGGGNEISNIAFGQNALGNNTTGSVCAAIGGLSLQQNTSGFGNVGLGYQAGNLNQTGNVNVFIGFQTGINVTGSSNLVIGNQAGGSWMTSVSNKLLLHNSSLGGLLYGDMATGQLQINAANTPALTASAALEVRSTTRGFLTPVMTTAQRTAISSPATGLEVFDTDLLRKMMYTGSEWKAVAWTSELIVPIDAQITTAQNTGTSETDLYTKTIAANTLAADKQTINFEADGEFNDNTATAQIKLYFAGNTTLNTGAVNISTANTAWKLKGYIIRTSSTTAHVTYEFEALGLATPKFLGYSNLTSLDFTTTNIIKITAQAGGAGGGTADITAHSWQVLHTPAP